MIALVFLVIAFSTHFGSILYVSGRQSTNTGFAPVNEIDEDEAIKLLAGVITSSPGPIPKARIPNSKADIPLSKPTAYFTPQNAANSFSNSETSSPKIKEELSITC